MNAKNQKPYLSSEKIQLSFLIWIISVLYLLPIVWFLLSAMGRYGAHEMKPWLMPAVAALTVSYGILMLLLWPHEKARCADAKRVVAATPLCHPRFLAAKLSRTCFSLFRQGSREFSDEWLHEECAARRRNVHLHAKRLKL